ncbi:MAG: hypothetical protein ABWK15_02650 [Dissulfuribacterales bacterium]
MQTFSIKNGEMIVSKEPGAVLEACSVGANLAVCIVDSKIPLAGLALVVLPQMPANMPNAFHEAQERLPALTAMSGLPLFFKRMLQEGVAKDRMKLWLVGASRFFSEPADLSLGAQTYTAVKKILNANKIKITAEHVGGQFKRCVRLVVGQDGVRIAFDDQEVIL